ncbi:MAG TPA: hypothetical protein VIX91_07590 [Candidatus Acidoferrum sp.]
MRRMIIALAFTAATCLVIAPQAVAAKTDTVKVEQGFLSATTSVSRSAVCGAACARFAVEGSAPCSVLERNARGERVLTRVLAVAVSGRCAALPK